VSALIRPVFSALAVASTGAVLCGGACTSTPDYLPPCITPDDPHCVLSDASADADASDGKPADAKGSVDRD
jgi:hypothetical protein